MCPSVVLMTRGSDRTASQPLRKGEGFIAAATGRSVSLSITMSAASQSFLTTLILESHLGCKKTTGWLEKEHRGLGWPDFVAKYIAHRRGREASILHRLGKGEADIPTLVRAIYIGLDPRLAAAAALSTLAHLEDLTARGLVLTEGAPSISGRYRLPP